MLTEERFVTFGKEIKDEKELMAKTDLAHFLRKITLKVSLLSMILLVHW